VCVCVHGYSFQTSDIHLSIIYTTPGRRQRALVFLYFRSYITQPGNVIRIYVPSTIFLFSLCLLSIYCYQFKDTQTFNVFFNFEKMWKPSEFLFVFCFFGRNFVSVTKSRGRAALASLFFCSTIFLVHYWFSRRLLPVINHAPSSHRLWVEKKGIIISMTHEWEREKGDKGRKKERKKRLGKKKKCIHVERRSKYYYWLL
jgi:hypothetical protein